MSNYYERKWTRCFFCDEHSKVDEPLERVETKWVTGKKEEQSEYFIFTKAVIRMLSKVAHFGILSYKLAEFTTQL